MQEKRRREVEEGKEHYNVTCLGKFPPWGLLLHPHSRTSGLCRQTFRHVLQDLLSQESVHKSCLVPCAFDCQCLAFKLVICLVVGALN